MKLIKSFQSLWPVWFPYPSAWFQAVISIMLGVGAGQVTSTILPEIKSLTSTAAAGFWLFFALIISVIPFVVYAYVYSFFWGDAPAGWPVGLPSPKSLWEGFFAFATFAITFCFGVIAVFFLASDSMTFSQTATNIVGTIWLSSAAYFYQAKIFIWRGMVAELEKKALGDEAAGVPPRYRLGRSAAVVNPAVKNKAKVGNQDDPFGEFKL